MANMKWIEELIGARKFRQVQALNLEELYMVNESNVNLAYYKRSPDENIEEYASLLINHQYKGINEVVDRLSLTKIVYQNLNRAGVEHSGKAKLADDIIELTRLFFVVTGADSIRLILKVVGDDACRKFHTDAYDLQLLCTYIGSGTEWIPDMYVNRKEFTGLLPYSPAERNDYCYD